MAIEPQAPATPESDGSGTSIEKFKTPEERDRAYVELEKLTYSQTQRMADLEKKLEQFEQLQQQGAAPIQDTRSFTDLYPGQPKLDQQETELASRLLTKPTEVLKQHAEWVRRETLREVQSELAAQRAIDRFQIENPDLVRHEEIVGLFVRKQPDNLSPTERLKRAAPEVRKYLADIAKGNNQQASPQLDPSTYVESPTSQPSGAARAPAAPASEEDELTEMIRERSAIQAKKRL